MGRNSYFAFKQFKVDQALCGMKITTDACLFGALVDVEDTVRILDIGTGTGLLSLMAAQRSNAVIDALDIEPGAQQQARENFTASPWHTRLSLHPCSAQNFQSDHKEKYDCILCNPPFFSDATPCSDNKRRLARHDDQLPLETLFQVMKNHLHNQGTCWIILPTEDDTKACDMARHVGLSLSKRIKIASSETHRPHRSILVFNHTARGFTETRLDIYREHPLYTEAFTALLQPYYLYL